VGKHIILELQFASRSGRTPVDPDLAKALPGPGWSDWLRYGSALAEALLEYFAGGADGCDLRTAWRFGKKDLEAFEHLRVIPRKLLNETDAAYRRNMEHMQAQPVALSTPYGPIKIREVVYLGAVKLKENQIGTVEFANALVASDTLLDALRPACRDLETGPVLDTRKGTSREGVKMLVVRDLFPAYLRDETVAELDSVRGGRFLRYRGLCSVGVDTDLSAVGDLSRDRTPDDHANSDFVVSRRLRHLLLEKGVKGIDFSPVLVEGTDAYDAYLGLWRELVERLGRNPRNRLDGAPP
jgi:hypothetical protein